MSRKGCLKTKMGRSSSQKVACMCTHIHCLNRLEGSGRLKFKWTCLEYKDQQKLERPHFDDNEDFKCPICHCQCAVLYYWSEENKLVAQSKQEIVESTGTKAQSKVDSFLGSLILL